MDQRTPSTRPGRTSKWYCEHSADPVGRLVLGLLRSADDPELVRASDDVCTGLQLVNFLQDVPRDLALGRIYLPAEDRRRFDVTVLDRPNERADAPARASRRSAREGCSRRAALQERIGGRLGRAVGLFARGGLAALDALEDAGWDIFTQRPRPSRLRLAREAFRAMKSRSEALRRGRAATRERARNFAYGIRVLPKPKRRAIAAIYAFAREVDDIADGDAPPDEKRGAAGGAPPPARRAAGRRRDVDRARRRARALPDLGAGAPRFRRRRADGPRPAAVRQLRRAPRVLRARRGRGRGRLHRRVRRRPAAARRDARDRAAADQHHARRPRGLGARTRLPPAGRARRARRRRGRHRAPGG